MCVTVRCRVELVLLVLTTVGVLTVHLWFEGLLCRWVALVLKLVLISCRLKRSCVLVVLVVLSRARPRCLWRID